MKWKVKTTYIYDIVLLVFPFQYRQDDSPRQSLGVFSKGLWLESYGIFPTRIYLYIPPKVYLGRFSSGLGAIYLEKKTGKATGFGHGFLKINFWSTAWELHIAAASLLEERVVETEVYDIRHMDKPHHKHSLLMFEMTRIWLRWDRWWSQKKGHEKAISISDHPSASDSTLVLF